MGFSDSPWSQPEVSREFVENAEIYVQERRRLVALMGDFLVHFFGNTSGPKTLDLGSGDGVLSAELLRRNPRTRATLVDGSREMLMKSDARVGMHSNVEYVEASFEDLLGGQKRLEGGFDLIVSSFAIHHLNAAEKRALFALVHGLLKPDGRTFIIDVVRAPGPALEGWYRAIWRGWMRSAARQMGANKPDEFFAEIERRYDDASFNKPDTLSLQLSALEDAGFREVDVYYKHGIFAAFGGLRP